MHMCGVWRWFSALGLVGDGTRGSFGGVYAGRPDLPLCRHPRGGPCTSPDRRIPSLRFKSDAWSAGGRAEGGFSTSSAGTGSVGVGARFGEPVPQRAARQGRRLLRDCPRPGSLVVGRKSHAADGNIVALCRCRPTPNTCSWIHVHGLGCAQCPGRVEGGGKWVGSHRYRRPNTIEARLRPPWPVRTRSS